MASRNLDKVLAAVMIAAAVLGCQTTSQQASSTPAQGHLTSEKLKRRVSPLILSGFKVSDQGTWREDVFYCKVRYKRTAGWIVCDEDGGLLKVSLQDQVGVLPGKNSNEIQVWVELLLGEEFNVRIVKEQNLGNHVPEGKSPIQMFIASNNKRDVYLRVDVETGRLHTYIEEIKKPLPTDAIR